MINLVEQSLVGLLALGSNPLHLAWMLVAARESAIDVSTVKIVPIRDRLGSEVTTLDTLVNSEHADASALDVGFAHEVPNDPLLALDVRRRAIVVERPIKE